MIVAFIWNQECRRTFTGKITNRPCMLLQIEHWEETYVKICSGNNGDIRAYLQSCSANNAYLSAYFQSCSARKSLLNFLPRWSKSRIIRFQSVAFIWNNWYVDVYSLNISLHVQIGYENTGDIVGYFQSCSGNNNQIYAALVTARA